MIESIDRVVNAIGGFLYRPYIVPLFLLAAGLYFTIRTGLIQFRLFGESIRVVKEKPKEKYQAQDIYQSHDQSSHNADESSDGVIDGTFKEVDE